MQKYRLNSDFFNDVNVSTTTNLMQNEGWGFSLYASDSVCVHLCTEKTAPIIKSPSLDSRGSSGLSRMWQFSPFARLRQRSCTTNSITKFFQSFAGSALNRFSFAYLWTFHGSSVYDHSVWTNQGVCGFCDVIKRYDDTWSHPIIIYSQYCWLVKTWSAFTLWQL